jgi:hypothetical protein
MCKPFLGLAIIAIFGWLQDPAASSKPPSSVAKSLLAKSQAKLSTRSSGRPILPLVSQSFSGVML